MYNLTAPIVQQPVMCTQPSKQRDDTSDLIIYIFALMCFNNTTCNGILRIIFATGFEIASAGIALIPAKELEKRFSSTKAIQAAKISMSVAWTAANGVGFYVGEKLYKHNLKYTWHPDPIDKFDAFSQAAMDASIAVLIQTVASACLFAVTQPPITRMYNNICARREHLDVTGTTNNISDRLLDDNNNPNAAREEHSPIAALSV